MDVVKSYFRHDSPSPSGVKNYKPRIQINAYSKRSIEIIYSFLTGSHPYIIPSTKNAFSHMDVIILHA